MDQRPKIEINSPPCAGPANVCGLLISPSQQAVDLLAAFHMGFEKGLTALRELSGITHPAPPQQVSLELPDREDFADFDDDSVDLGTIMGMPPVAREAMLSRYGLKVAAPPPVDPDPTQDILREQGAIMPEEGEEE